MDAKATFDAGLAPGERALVQTAREFAAQHLDIDTPYDIATHRRLLQQACRRGLAGIEVPARFGGAGASYSTRMRVCEALASHHAGFAFSLVNHHNIVSRIAQSGGAVLQDALVAKMLDGGAIGCTAMTEPQSGSDFATMRMNAVKTQDGWVLNGAKAWIANASLADVFLVYAQTDPDKGAAGVAGFIVLADDAGFRRGQAYDAPSAQGMGVGQFALEDCLIPDARVLYPPGDGFRAAMRGVNQARVHVAAMNAAMVERALNASLGYAESRQAFGNPVIEFQGLGWSLANVATHLQAMRLLAYAAAQTIDAGEDAQVIAAMAKKYANDHAMQAISACMQAMGAHGITEEAGLARLLGWAKAFCYTDGTPEMMNERIVRCMRKVQRK
ncbi:acyl-CoA dehydrogenase family protein [Paracandidimonas lactea]|uniref:acyl-CoA dehydrogenase family protein n=1 Tax=Paracandidimonas lactea TaxID=2895524 RepID=UPI001F1CB59D|nr:acyl-CoA dehydrogenase family protein [Paracandidimonas lactea]